MQEKVKHRSRPSEPFGQVGAHGKITRTGPDGPLRVTPAYRGIPAQAHVEWLYGDSVFHTWEALSDLIQIGGKR